MLIYFMLMVLMCMEVSTAAGARMLDYKAGMEQGIVQVEASGKRNRYNTLHNRSNTTERAHNT